MINIRVKRQVRTKWVAPNKCCGTFFVHWFGLGHWSITANKENVVAFFQFEYAEFSGYVHFFQLRPFGPKNQNCQLILKFSTWINSNMQNSMVMFPILGFGPKYLFWAYLLQKFKFVCSGKNLLPRLLRICRTQWRCSLYLCQTGNTLFRQVWSKK